MDRKAYEYMTDKIKKYDIYTKEIDAYEDILETHKRYPSSNFYLTLVGKQVLTPPEVQNELLNIIQNSINVYRSLRDEL